MSIIHLTTLTIQVFSAFNLIYVFVLIVASVVTLPHFRLVICKGMQIHARIYLFEFIFTAVSVKIDGSFSGTSFDVLLNDLINIVILLPATPVFFTYGILAYRRKLTLTANLLLLTVSIPLHLLIAIIAFAEIIQAR